jgi:outer membrane autotransporter protein
MVRVGWKELSGRAVAAVLFASMFTSQVHAQTNSCTPATSAQAPANNTTVTCSGTVVNQNGLVGWGTGVETGDTINVQTDASVIGPAAGIFVNDATIINAGRIGIAGGVNFGVAAQTGVTINNSGTIHGDVTAVEVNQGSTVIINSNTGLIEATGVKGIAIDVAGDATVSSSGTIQATTLAIRALSTAMVNNLGGRITGGSSAILADNVVVSNSGLIEVTGAAQDAIGALSKAAVHNLAGGTISATRSAIVAGSIDVTNDNGATITGGTAIAGSGTVRNAGTISGSNVSVQFNGAGTNTLILQTGSVLTGDAIGGAGPNQLILQGNGSADNNFLNFNTLDVQADNAWIWNNTSTIGATTITSGTLAVDGGLTSPVSVNSGGTLAGRGTVTGDVTVASGGAVAPGAVAPFSTLSVAGNVAFQPGSLYRVNVNAAGQNDRLAVTGIATLAGGAVNVGTQNGFAVGTPYTILTAAGGLGGTTFGGVSAQGSVFITPTLSYDANDVFLTFNVANGGGGGNGFGFTGVAQTPNQIGVAGALDASTSTNPLVAAVLGQTVEGARQAFDALSGEVYGSVQNVQAGNAQFARGAVLGRLRQASYAGVSGDLGALGFAGPELAYADAGVNAAYAKAMPGSAPERTRDLTFWTQALGGWAHADSDGNAASVKSRFGGFLSGADARLGDTWRAGLVAGYLRTNLNVNDRASSAGIDSVQVGGYLGGSLGAVNVRGGASFFYDSIDTSRAIVFPGFSDQAHASFHGNVGQVFGEVGYGMTLGHVAVEPLAGLAYVHVHDGSFAESGGVAALSGSSANESTGYSTLGVRAATALPLANGTALIPRGSLQWQYAFGDVTPVTALAFQSTGTSFTVAGIPIARNTALIEGGFDWRFSQHAKLGASYVGELAAHAQSHAVKGAFSWDF